MNRSEFMQISQARVAEALALLKAGHPPGAYYLMGYSIECALKACVAKQVKRYDFPDKKLANEAFVHDLERTYRDRRLWLYLLYLLETAPFNRG